MPKFYQRKIRGWRWGLVALALIAVAYAATHPAQIFAKDKEAGGLAGINVGQIIDQSGPVVSILYPTTENDAVNAQIKEFTDSLLDGFMKAYGGEGEAAFYVTFDKFCFNGDIVSFRFNTLAATDALAHPAASQYAKIFDLKTGEETPPLSLLNDPDDLEGFSKMVYEHLKGQEPFKDNPNEMEMLFEGTAPVPKNFRNMVIDHENLIVLFDAYQVSSGAARVTEAKIPLENAEPFLAPRFHKANASAAEEPTGNAIAKEEERQQPAKGGYKATDKLVALTFDDGPSPLTTPKLLDYLRDAQVRATFYVIGKNAEHNEGLIKRAYFEGHQIGNHTLDHINLRRLGSDGMAQQVSGADNILKGMLRQEPSTFRPPEGAYSDEALAYLNGRPLVLWDVDPVDWMPINRDPQIVYHNVVDAVQDGDIILLHDIRETTVEAVPLIIEKLKGEGYVFVTVDELIKLRGNPDDLIIRGYPNPGLTP
ncbi:MAG: polysaccharide deacetylase family protein [Turicibacter sp.]|nr:polysaccharide deacetylase family protein [Turicibacter sp.]